MARLAAQLECAVVTELEAAASQLTEPNDKTLNCETVDHVPADLLVAAKTAFRHAYAPYSNFKVGAALRGESGAVYAGANVENASYGLGRCAEQSAVQALASAGERHFDSGVVYTEADRPATPCGACRQVLLEFAPDAELFFVNHLGGVKRYTVRDLLPDAFRLER